MHDDLLLFGTTTARGIEQKVGIPVLSLLLHAIIGGVSGCGKSWLAMNLAIQLALAGFAVFYFDVKGDESSEIIRRIPRSERHRIVYLNIREGTHRLNVLGGGIFNDPYRLAQELSLVNDEAIAERGDPKTPRQETYLRMIFWCVAKGMPLLEQRDGSLLDVKAFLLYRPFRWKLLDCLKNAFPDDGRVREIRFQMSEMEKAVASDRRLIRDISFESLINKLPIFTDDEILSRWFAVKDSTLPIAEIVRSNSIVLIDSSDLPMDALRLANMVLVTYFLNAAMTRKPEERIPQFYFFDEFYLYNCRAMREVTRLRSYRVGLVFITQSDALINPYLVKSIVDSCSTTIALRTGGNMAPLLARQFGGAVGMDDLISLKNYVAWVKHGHKAFCVRTIPLPDAEPTPEVIALPPAPPLIDELPVVVRETEVEYAPPERVFLDLTVGEGSLLWETTR